MALIFSFIGFSGSGKTSSIESLIKYLNSQAINKKIIVLKHIHQENFTIDTEGKDTYKYSKAGSNTVIAQSEKETAFILNKSLNIKEILTLFSKFYSDIDETILIFESFRNINHEDINILPQTKLFKILCVPNEGEIEEQLKNTPDYISGSIFAKENIKDLHKAQLKYQNYKFIDIMKNPEQLIQDCFNENL